MILKEHSAIAQILLHCRTQIQLVTFIDYIYEGWNFNSGNYLFTTDTK